MTSPEVIYWIKRFLSLFYIVTPSEYACQGSVFEEAWPFFVLFIVLENIILFVQRKSTLRLNDGMISIIHGAFFESGRIITRGAENLLYHHVFENYKLFEVDCESLFNWYAMAIVVDFLYYWVHRASHEIHILWAQHQVHHSSEDYNLTVGFRHPFLHNWCGFIFYLPMALCISPKAFIVHQQLNLLYQFWVHTSTVSNLGPLEYVLNTPAHHKVHHASNKIYLDKNYGGVLIVWDRLFGTFQNFEPSSPLIFGIISQPHTMNPLYQQFFYMKNVYNKCIKMEGWSNKMQSIIKGPSWLPGRPWTGCDEDKIEVGERAKYDPKSTIFLKFYSMVHLWLCLIILYSSTKLADNSPNHICIVYAMISLCVIGMLIDNSSTAAIRLEMIRCYSTYIVVNLDFFPQFEYSLALKAICGISSLIWSSMSVTKWLHYSYRANKFHRCSKSNK